MVFDGSEDREIKDRSFVARTFPVNISLPLLQWFSNWFSLISLVSHGSGGPQIKDTSFVHKPLQSRRGGGGGGGGDGGGDGDGDNGPLPSGPFRLVLDVFR